MSSGFDFLVTNLERRYDFQSARTLTRQALSAAGLKEQASYTPEELQRFVDQLSKIGTHLDRVWGALGTAPSGKPVPAVAPAAAPAAAPAQAEAPANVEEAPAAPAAEPAKAEAAPAPEAPPAEAAPAAQAKDAPAAEAKAKAEGEADDKGGDRHDKKKKK